MGNSNSEIKGFVWPHNRHRQQQQCQGEGLFYRHALVRHYPGDQRQQHMRGQRHPENTCWQLKIPHIDEYIGEHGHEQRDHCKVIGEKTQGFPADGVL
jgi:hypothetical protein